MENAAKALLIAGGILIAIMVLTVLVYAITARDRIEKAEYEKAQAEKIAKFNSEFEAYNKNRLYGIDVITVINKAIAHNQRMNASNEDDKYFINVEFITKEDFKSEVRVIDNTSEKKDEIQIEDLSNIDTSLGLSTEEVNTLKLGTTAVINKDNRYILGNVSTENDIKLFITNLNFKNIFESNKTDVVITTHNTATVNDNGTKTYKLYSALTNFKKAIFACTNSNYVDSNNGNYKLVDEVNNKPLSNGVTYGEDGRINSIRFIQVDTRN